MESALRVLIVGLSSIAQRRVLPALSAMETVETVDIASRSRQPPEAWGKPGRFHSDFQHAIRESEAELLYVSLPNSDHLNWILAGLDAGKHVVTDKPATLTLADSERCAGEARRRSLLLAEATVFSYHAQFEAMKAFFSENGPLTHIDAQFIIPPLPLENFRNHRKLGGGCLHDMGPYAAALARLFGGGALTSLAAYPAPPAEDRDIDVGFSLAAQFAGGIRMTGHFSFESEYCNRIELIGKGGSLTTERVFSPPAEHEPYWQVRRRNEASDQTLPASDVFRAFLKAVAQAVATGEHDRFLEDLLIDAAFRDRLASALDQGKSIG